MYAKLANDLGERSSEWEKRQLFLHLKNGLLLRDHSEGYTIPKTAEFRGSSKEATMKVQKLEAERTVFVEKT